MKRSKTYFTLICFMTVMNRWEIVFGDYDRETVEDEAETIELDKYLSKKKIISSGDTQKEIDAKVEEINTLERAKKILKIAKESYVENT